MPPKINLALVAGTGRSGSTLLEMILGAHSRIATCGEIQIWPHEIMMNGFKPCGCGKAMPDCPFWSEALRRINPLEQPEPRIHHFREHHHYGKVIRWNLLLHLSRKVDDRETDERIHTYAKNNYEVYKVFLDLTEELTGKRPEWVVDSSKDPYRLLWLVKSGLFNIRVLHSVRDPRGFVYSTIKLSRRKMTFGRMLVRHAVRKSLLWTFQNDVIARIAQAHLRSGEYSLIRYETLATSPRRTIEGIMEMLGCEFEEEMLTRFRGGAHAVAGNPMRHDDRGITLDEAWRQKLPFSCALLSQFLTLTSRRRFGYR